MDYLKQKLSIYREVTNLTYEELSKLLNVPPSTLFRFMSKRTNSIPNSLIDGMNELLDIAVANLAKVRQDHSCEASTLWPELFLPRMRDVKYVFSQNKLWCYSKEPHLPTKMGPGWYYSDSEGNPRRLTYHGFSNIFCPPWPTDEKYSLLRQTRNGWVKENEFDFGVMGKECGAWHIPGNTQKPVCSYLF